MLAVFGVILWAVAGALLWHARNILGRAAEIAATESTTVAALLELCREVGVEVGAGAFRQRVELKGTLRCPRPVQGELSGAPCAHCVTHVERKYEETVDVRDANGRVRQETRSGTERVSEVTRTATPVLVEDATGSVELALGQADLALRTVHDRFQPHHEATDPSLLRLLASAALGNAHGRRTVGYRAVERIFPVDARVFVLGEASDSGGSLVVGKGKGELLVSLKTEEELLADSRSSATWSRVGAAACAVVGVGLVVAAFVQR